MYGRAGYSGRANAADHVQCRTAVTIGVHFACAQREVLVATSGTRSSTQSHVARRTLLTLAIIGIVSLWRLWPAVDSTPFHRDEARWIGNSTLLREWRHPLSSRWQDEGYRNRYGTIDESNRRRSQPPLAMYVFGFGLLAQGKSLPSTGYWIMTEDTEWNVDHGNMPTDAQLRAARRTNVVIALITVITIYFIARQLAGEIAGIAAAFSYALHPLVLSTATRAWSDPLLVLWLVLAVAAAMRYGNAPSIPRATLVGVLLGLGAATKLSPLLLAVFVGSFGLILTLWALLRLRSIASKHFTFGIGMLCIPVAALLTFLAVYPYLWTAPISHTRRMFDFRSLSFDLQAEVSPQARVDGLPDAMRRIGMQLSDRYSVGGLASDVLHQHTGVQFAPSLADLDLTLAIAGWLLLVSMLFARRFPPARALPLSMLAIQACLIAGAFRLDYSRYLLPMVPAVAIGIGAVIGTGWDCITHYVWSSAQDVVPSREPGTGRANTMSAHGKPQLKSRLRHDEIGGSDGF